jgi:protein-tyrosine phosphatase
VSHKTDKIGVLFVCLGNICRSPLAEGVFRHLARAAGVEDRFEIDSAGTSGYHDGDPPDQRTAAVATARGIELTGQSRRITSGDMQRFDYVIVMDEENHSALARMAHRTAPRARVHLLREFDPEANGDPDVPDPYYGGTRGFENVHDIVERSARALLDHLRQQHAI